ncbi:MAG: glycosyltransferase family 4 protein [Sedimentisphaerales bacterium]|nr:glycosyltransferase family 4 protein [Sedimentisphaerales bacterium]
MRIHILFEFKEGPWGGGNQFLKSLKQYLQSADAYEDDAQKADVILFNSYQYIDDTAKVKLKYRDKLFVHRIDGPIRLYNKESDRRDFVTNAANHLIAEATIFQSGWSRDENHRLGLKKNKFEAVITNAPDPQIFNRKGKEAFSANRKMKLIAASWSPNWNKGFGVYQWLDEHLDFDKYEMVFVGNSPITFKNIINKPPLNSVELACELKKNDVFVFASPMEACSNSLLEALHCGLPVVAANSSSNPELVTKAGEVFDRPEEIPQLLDKITKRYADYQVAINMPSANKVGKQYYDFISHVHQQVQDNSAELKRFGRVSFTMVMAAIYRWKLTERVSAQVVRFIKSK